MSLGLRYAGTAHPEACRTVMYFAKHFKCLRDGKPDPLVDLVKDSGGVASRVTLHVINECCAGPGVVEEPQVGGFMAQSSASLRFAAQRPDRVTIETCLACAALAMACIMAGTGDVDCLRLIREMRWKVETEVRSSKHRGLTEYEDA